MKTRMTNPHRVVPYLFGATSLFVVGIASAQQAPANPNPNCPPGSWFCVSEAPSAPAQPAPSLPINTQPAPVPQPQAPTPPAQPAPSAPQAPAVVILPSPPQAAPQPQAPSAPAPAAPASQQQTQGGQTVIIYNTQPAPSAPAPVQPAPQPAIPQAQQPPQPVPQPTPRRQPPPPPRRPASRAVPLNPGNVLPRQEFGLHLSYEQALFSSSASGGAVLSGFALGFRYKPAPALGVEAAIAGYGGRDYNGLDRSEFAGTLNAMLFVNPRSLFQFYLVGGVGVSTANVSGYHDYYKNIDTQFSYVGVQGGAGLEYRLGRHVAFNTELRGFVRSRTDSNDPAFEFVKSDGSASNTSGGGVLTFGTTLYF